MKFALCPIRALLAGLLLAGCATPLIITAQVDTGGSTAAVARTNLRQWYLRGGEATFLFETMTEAGIPIFLYSVSEGAQLYIDRDADIRIESEIGTPLPASAKVLFPRPGEAAALGITFLEAE